MDNWDQILAEHAAPVWRTAYRILSSTADADECMQDAFVEAVRVHGREKVRDWGALLRRLATTRSLDRLRRRMRERAHLSEGPDPETLPSACESPDARKQRGELSDRLRRALSRLPAEQAQVFCLRHVEEMSYEDIAEQVQLSVNSVGVILYRARERLRALLKDLAMEMQR